MLEKLKKWFRATFHSIDNPDKVDWILLFVIVVVTVSLVALAYAMISPAP